MRRAITLLSITTLSLALAGCVGRQVATADTTPTMGTARADLRNVQGSLVGTATLEQTPNGVLITADIANLPAGTHAIHIHAVGRCDPPFESAGGHFNPTLRQHGARNPQGDHAGDLPNIYVPTSGATRVEMITRAVSFETSGTGLFDADGSSLVVHAAADDYRTDPAGASGNRIACGVVTR